MTEIRFLPEDTSPQSDDWLLVQKADTNADKKISIENLTSIIQPATLTDLQIEDISGLQSALDLKANSSALALLGNSLHPGFIPGRYYLMTPLISSTFTSALHVGYVYYTSIYIPRDCSFPSILTQNLTGLATAKCRIGIYENNNGLPGTLLTSSNEIALGTLGYKTATTSISFTKGWYFCALTANATINFSFINVILGFSLLVGAVIPSTTVYSGWRADFAYGNLPSSAPLTNVYQSSSPAFWFGT
jgi:hypothetical protein